MVLVLNPHPMTLRDSCCTRLGIPPEAYEQTVLSRCVSGPGKVWWHLHRKGFQADLELIRAVAACTTMQDVYAELTNHRYHHPNRGFIRKVLRLRLSGQRLVDFAAQFLR